MKPQKPRVTFATLLEEIAAGSDRPLSEVARGLGLDRDACALRHMGFLLERHACVTYVRRQGEGGDRCLNG